MSAVWIECCGRWGLGAISDGGMDNRGGRSDVRGWNGYGGLEDGCCGKGGVGDGIYMVDECTVVVRYYVVNSGRGFIWH